MQQFASLAEHGRQALAVGDRARLHQLINANFDLRRQICDLHPHHVAMIETARSVGVSAKFCGSGGAIIGTWENEAQLEQLRLAMAPLDCEVCCPRIV
jgi:glucuronokinase